MKLSAPIFRLKRQARLLARSSAIPLHAALDQVARKEGFHAWSQLAASTYFHQSAREMLAQLDPGDLLLLGGRPGHGKTLMGLELAVEAVRAGRPAFFFTLEDNDGGVFDRLERLGSNDQSVKDRLTVDPSDDICASYIIDRIGGSSGAVAVIDYLQLLDQRRSNPELDVQMEALRSFAVATGSIIVALSQIDRSFDATGRLFPERADIRRPNPLDTRIFTKACFMHNGEARLDRA